MLKAPQGFNLATLKEYANDEKLKKAYHGLAAEDGELYKWVSKAISDLEKNAFCGIQIPKRLIPKCYIRKYGIDNLWKHNMPKGWRLIYSVAHGKVCIITIILEWMKHKDYEKRFRY